MKENNWYDNRTQLEEAIRFILDYSCCYGWKTFASSKTPCCDYAAEDANIPDGLKIAIKQCLRNLSKADRQEINRQVSSLLGERFYVREDVIVKIFSRILSYGNQAETSKDMIVFSLQMQIKQRMELLEKLA